MLFIAVAFLSAFFLIQFCGLHDLSPPCKLLRAIAAGRKKEEKKCDLSIDGCFRMFMIIMIIITVRFD